MTPTSHRVLQAALQKVIDASRAYLPPDGIGKDEFISRVLEATDNKAVVEAMEGPFLDMTTNAERARELYIEALRRRGCQPDEHLIRTGQIHLTANPASSAAAIDAIESALTQAQQGEAVACPHNVRYPHPCRECEDSPHPADFVPFPYRVADTCFACGRNIGRLESERMADTRDGQLVYVGVECFRKIKQAGAEGWQPPNGGPRLWLESTAPPAPVADAARGLADMLDPGKQADTLRKAADALREAEGRDREADRARFPDDDFNAWLDCGISDCGHTVYDSIGCIADAWQGWHAHVVHLMVNDPASVDIGIFEAGVGPDGYVREGIED